MKKFLSLLLALVLALSLVACGGKDENKDEQDKGSDEIQTEVQDKNTEDEEPAGPVTLTDRGGNEFTLEGEVKTIISMAPSITRTLIHLGCKDMIVAADSNTTSTVEGMGDVTSFEMMTLDVEQMAALEPDLILVSGLSMWDGSEPFKPLQEMGIAFAVIPTAATIDDIYEDITFIGSVVGKESEAAAINDELKAGLDEIAEKAATIPEEERKSVYFEIASAPYFYSTGANTYLDEMITLAGGKNVMADQEGWISVSAENIAAANPDVILTNTDYIPDAVGDLLAQDGWSEVTAIANEAVYYIDTASSAQPNENIVVALRQMAEALYPDVFAK